MLIAHGLIVHTSIARAGLQRLCCAWAAGCPAAHGVGPVCYRWIVQLKLADPDAPVVSVAVTVTE
jgi:hypothetical protein